MLPRSLLRLVGAAALAATALARPTGHDASRQQDMSVNVAAAAVQILLAGPTLGDGGSSGNGEQPHPHLHYQHHRGTAAVPEAAAPSAFSHRTPRVIGGSGTVEKFIQDVKEDYLDPMNATYEVKELARSLIASKLVWRDGQQRHYDISTPDLRTCAPVLSSVTAIGPALYCPSTSAEPCGQKTTLSLRQEYAATEGFELSTTIKGGGGVDGKLGFISVEVSVTASTYWSKTWTYGKETSFEYTFSVAPGDSCTPSVVHVDLECDMVGDRVFFDTWWNGDGLLLATESNRKGGPYAHGQWCTKTQLYDTQFFPAEPPNWQPVDKRDKDLGYVWLPRSTALNADRRPGAPAIDERQLVIRREYHDEYFGADVFVCDPVPSNGETQKVRVPLSEIDGNVRGAISCVTN
jgi:hypothetical protein